MFRAYRSTGIPLALCYSGCLIWWRLCCCCQYRDGWTGSSWVPRQQSSLHWYVSSCIYCASANCISFYLWTCFSANCQTREHSWYSRGWRRNPCFSCRCWLLFRGLDAIWHRGRRGLARWYVLRHVLEVVVLIISRCNNWSSHYANGATSNCRCLAFSCWIGGRAHKHW